MLVFVITLSEKSYFSLFRLSRFYDKMEGREAVQRFINLIKTPIDIKSLENGFVPKKIIGRVEFRGVDFKYAGAKGQGFE